jgi:PAS domain S-box-containing protein
LAESFQFGAQRDDGLHVLWQDGERVFCRTSRISADGNQGSVLVVLPAAEHPTPASLDRLAHEYNLRDELDGGWAVRPLALERERGRTVLVLEDSGGEQLDRLLGARMEVGRFLRLAIGIVTALGKAHRRGLIHKDLKPANILLNRGSGEVRLTGFGIASRLPRERQAPDPPDVIAGTLAYMAPEQTGRMNRSIDSRCDLYALGVTLYQMLTGSLPFAASDPMEWVHCHIARQPVPPSERLDGVPPVVSAIIMKLLAKTAEERYQTAGGVERDLRRCLAEWERHGHIEPFAPGERDAPDRLLMPERLYGREREVATLLASFDRMVKSGAPELVLVAGYSGIGKSSVINELHKVLVPSRGLFAEGKFDQYKRDIPYSTVAEAFQSLVRPLLGKNDTELSGWRDALLEALGQNGRLMTDLVPELKLIIGEQPPVTELPAQDAQRRFQLVFRRFIGAFARPQHPLALFLDDLQWLDAATLDLMEDLLTQPEVRHLMLIGAYRDNEVDAAHPLMRKLDAIKAVGGKVGEIALAPLSLEHLVQLIAGALRCEPARAAPLAELVHEKTGGNPFFAIQFVSSLADEGMLVFDHDNARWSWDPDRIHAKGYTDSVVDLMVEKLSRLPDETQIALQQLACLGSAEITTLSIIFGISEAEVHSLLWEAVRQDLVERMGRHYKYIHDRVQEAAYSLIPEGLRAATHLRIGRRLAARTTPEQREEAIFEIVNQLNRGATLIATREERERLADFNLIAGKRAKASSAYASALSYLAAGVALLPEDAWERRHELAFALELNLAECEFLIGDLEPAEKRLSRLSQRARSLLENAAVASLRITLYTTLDQTDRSVEVGLDYLRHVGVRWPRHPDKDEVRHEYERLRQQLATRPIEAIAELPRMTDPDLSTTLNVLMDLQPSAAFTDRNLHALVVGRIANLSLEHGNDDASCHAYVWVGIVMAMEFGDYRAGFRFGKLGLDLVERRGLDRFRARVYLGFAVCLSTWGTHLRTTLDLVRRAHLAAQRTGDLTYVGYCDDCAVLIRLASGDHLADVHREAEDGLEFARRMRFGLVIDILTGRLQFIRALRGLTPSLASFDNLDFHTSSFERRLDSDPRFSLAKCYYWTQKLQALFHAGEYRAAAVAASQVEVLLTLYSWFYELTVYHFFAALVQAALHDTASASERPQHRQGLRDHYEPLKLWAESCPENFENRAALVSAEIARIEGRDGDAMRFYEQSVRLARANGFVHYEALAYELASRFYAARGFEDIAHLYLQKARAGYQRWGADGKVRQLDEIHRHLSEGQPVRGPTSTIETAVEHLDLAIVLKVSQAISGETALDKLIDTLMRIAVEQAGAERGLLIIAGSAEPRIEAEATTTGDKILVQPRDEIVSAAVLSEAVLHYVLRTRESVILDDAAAEHLFAADPYIRERGARSILCMPLLTPAKLIGALYLENNLAPRVFAANRSAVLKLLASQAAIALENTYLYRDLEQREAKIRRLVEANIIGIFIWNLAGQVIEANEAFLRIMGYDRDDLASGCIRWTDLTPPELRERDAKAVDELRMTGTAQPYEKEYIRKDGSRVPVLVGGAIFEESGNQGVAFVLDLTERKRTDQALREAQMELAHANRVATMGQLSASISHEVKQPIAAAITEARAGLRWLSAEPPDVEEAKQALACVVENGKRADDIIGRIRNLFNKKPLQKGSVDMNEAIREVIELTRGEAVKNGISVRTELADGLPFIEADRVQLQQVALNLIVNSVQAMSAVGDGERELLITTARAVPEGVLVAVKDSGPGLAPDSPERIFEPFYSTKPGGLGMGLSICRSIIEAHGGRLWASANQSGGATFQFMVPVHSDGAN